MNNYTDITKDDHETTICIRKRTKDEAIQDILFYTELLIGCSWYDFERRKYCKERIRIALSDLNNK